MSTYLVAFVVGEFDFVEGKDVDGVPIRVYTPMKKAVQGQFALEVVVVVVFIYFELFSFISLHLFLNLTSRNRPPGFTSLLSLVT